LLVELARWAHQENVGDYAALLSELMRGTGILENESQVAPHVLRHIAHCFVSLSDVLTFRSASAMHGALDRVSLAGIEHLDQALSHGRGVMMLSVTQSHPSFCLSHPRLAGIDFSIVANTHVDAHGRSSPFLDSLADRVELLPVSPAAVRRLLARLRSGGVVAIYADFRFRESQGIRVPLFGRPTMFARSAVAIALKTRARVLPVVSVRRGELESMEVEVRFFPALPLADLADLPADNDAVMTRAALRFAVAVEALIRYDPATWRLWGTLPYRWQEAAQA
jgi:lauroyl/myristoyl acyltransferase